MTLGSTPVLENNEKQNTDLENKEKLNQNLQKLSEKVKENLNSKCILSRNPYAPGIGLDNVDNIKEIKTIISSSLSSDDEYSVPLKELYNNYIKKQPLGEQYKKYHEPYNDTKTNSTTEATIAEASFILKDFLEDLEKTIKEKKVLSEMITKDNIESYMDKIVSGEIDITKLKEDGSSGLKGEEVRQKIIENPSISLDKKVEMLKLTSGGENLLIKLVRGLDPKDLKGLLDKNLVTSIYLDKMIEDENIKKELFNEEYKKKLEDDSYFEIGRLVDSKNILEDNFNTSSLNDLKVFGPMDKSKADTLKNLADKIPSERIKTIVYKSIERAEKAVNI